MAFGIAAYSHSRASPLDHPCTVTPVAWAAVLAWFSVQPVTTHVESSRFVRHPHLLSVQLSITFPHATWRWLVPTHLIHRFLPGKVRSM